MKNIKQKLLYKALQSSCQAEEDEAVANLVVYFKNAAGIGEHPQVVEEMKKQLEKAANARDRQEYLSEVMKKYVKD